jgi:hypothetical protein
MRAIPDGLELVSRGHADLANRKAYGSCELLWLAKLLRFSAVDDACVVHRGLFLRTAVALEECASRLTSDPDEPFTTLKYKYGLH